MTEDIRLSVELDSSEVQKEANELQKEISAIFKNVSGDELDKQFKQLLNRLDKTSSSVTKVQNKISELATEKIPTKEYINIQKEVEKAYKEFDKLDEKVKKAKETGSIYGPAFTDLYVSALNAEDKVNSLLDTMRLMESEGKDFTWGSDTEEFSDAIVKLNQLINSMKIATSTAYELDEGLQEAVQFELHPQEIDELTQRANEVSKVINNIMQRSAMAATTIGEFFGKLASDLDNMRAVLSNVKRDIDTIIGTLNRLTKRVKSVLTLSSRKLSDINNMTSLHSKDLDTIFKKMLKWGLGIRSTFILWRKLRAYAQDALKLMAQQFEEVDKDVSNIINTFAQFRNMVGTAVQPLMHTFAPAIINIIDLLNQASVALANFFAIFTGNKYIYKAKKSNDSYAESLKGTAKAAKEANEELAEYDNLLVIPQDKSGSGSGKNDDEELLDNFEKTLAHSSFAEQLRQAIDNDDWEGVGNLFADKLNTITARLNTWINTQFRPKARIWAERLADTLNCFVAETKFNAIGDTVGDAIMTGLETVNTFLEKFNFTELGQQLSEGINGLANSIDGKTLGKTFALQLNSMFDLFLALVENIDFDEIADTLGDAFNTFLEEVEPEKLGKGISVFLTKVFTAIARLIDKIDWTQLGETLGEVFANIDWDSVLGALGDVIVGLIDGISEAFKGWESIDSTSASIAELVLSLIALSSTLSILLPLIQTMSIVLKAMKFMWVGIGSAISKVSLLFSNLASVIYLVATGAGTLHEAMTVVFGPMATLISGVALAISGVALAISNFVSMLIKGFSWVKEILMVVGIALAAIGAVILGAPALVAAAVAGIVALVATAIAVVVNSWNDIVDLFNEGINLIWNLLQGIWSFITNLANDIWSSITTIITNIVDGVVDVVDSITNTIDNMIDAIWTGISNLINWILGGVEGLVNGIITMIEGMVNLVITGVNFMINALNRIAVDIPDFLGGGHIGFDINTLDKISLGRVAIPKLAQGAVIPPNSPFLAMLGDQKSGTNIETPLSTMIEAFKTALGDFNAQGTSNNQTIVLQLDKKIIAQAVWDENEKRYKQTGKYAMNT